MQQESSDKTGVKQDTKFRKGQSGNPKGRPVGQKNYATLYRDALIKLAKLNNKKPDELELEMISKGILSARAGDYRFYKDVLDRLLGTAQNNVNISGEITKKVISIDE